MSIYDAYLTPPSLDIGDDLNPEGSVLFYQLSNLSSCAMLFGAAVQLFDYANGESDKETAEGLDAASHPAEDGERRIAKIRAYMNRRKSSAPYVLWAGIAARDGGMTLFHTLRSMQSVKTTLDRSKAIRDKTKVEMKTIEKSLSLFREKFPDITEVRNAIAHNADILKNPEKNAFTGGYESDAISIGEESSGFFMGNLEGNKFTTTGYDGKLLKYEISADSLIGLLEIIKVHFSAFPDRYAKDWRPS
ncbi:hypothetical protein [Mesorhizobium sp. GbtcB19]|uniref:hypothetical protein n=1 Tax=Mesorhizobium sp. GbtcB19 TaxID=2824764 RepID=UPI001C3115DF|nr:hypothetical protein [Mesorhizobium sp. GbtcB19]